MFSRILDWIRKVFAMINPTQTQNALGVEIAVSDIMSQNLTEWDSVYTKKPKWLSVDEGIISLNLGAAIASEISRVTVTEMKVNFGETPRDLFLAAQFKKVMDKLRENVEYGAAKGGLMFKPYIDGESIAVDYVQAENFFPVKFDANGRITAVIFSDTKIIDKKYYTRLEYHSMGDFPDERGVLVPGYRIVNKAFVSNSKDSLGTEIQLSEVEDWADLAPEGIIKNVTRPLFGYFRYPSANNIDTTSPLGISCFARACDIEDGGLMKQADIQWSQITWEFESGKRALYLDMLAFGRDDDGEPYLPNKRLYRTLNGSGNLSNEEMYHEWSPTFREESLLNGLEAILRKIEFVTGLDYGRLSNPDAVALTATEISASQQRFFSTITDVQKALSESLDELVYAMDVWATVGKLAPQGKYTVGYNYDDSILIDKDKQFAQDSSALSLGVMSKVEFRMRTYKEDEATAIKKIAEARKEKADDLKIEVDAFGGSEEGS